MYSAYQVLGKFYDRLIEYPYQFALSLVTQKHKSGKALDLFCGTGRFSMLLAEQGFTVEASDLSGEMLQEGMTSASKRMLKILFKKENALEFAFSSPFDVITATSDGINYLTDEELKSFFPRVYSALIEGGRFVFDMSTRYKLTEILGNELYYEDLEDLTYFWQNTLRKKDNSVKMELTFFEKNSQGLYIRSDECQRQYSHTLEYILEISRQCGFKIINVLDEKNRAPKAKSERIFFILEK